jgi:O-antigen ligase
MTHDIQTLTQWLEAMLVVAAFFTTAFPLLFMWCTWYKLELGRLLMLQAVAFALAMDVTCLFTFWNPGPNHILLEFWTEAFVFTLIAISTACLTYMLWRENFSGGRWKKLFKLGRKS